MYRYKGDAPGWVVFHLVLMAGNDEFEQIGDCVVCDRKPEDAPPLGVKWERVRSE